MQLLVGITVLGVLASFAFARLSTALRLKTLQGEAQGLTSLLREARSTGLKKNLQIGFLFDGAHQRYRLFEDANGDGVWEPGESIRDLDWSGDLRIGPGKQAPAKGPTGTAVPASGLAGTWSKALLFAKDPMATPNTGAVYLHHGKLDAWTACLVNTPTAPQIQAYLWDGKRWRTI